MPTIFPKPDDGNSQQTTPLQRPASERRKQNAVSTSYKNLMIKHSLLKAMFYIIQTVVEAPTNVSGELSFNNFVRYYISACFNVNFT